MVYISMRTKDWVDCASQKRLKLGQTETFGEEVYQKKAQDSSILCQSICEIFMAAPKKHFKKQLDHFLCAIPDEPLLPGYVSFKRADSNSVTDMVKHWTFQVE